VNHADFARLCERGYRESTARLKGDVEYWITEYDGETVIVPRGTEVANWWRNGGWLDVIRDVRFVPWYDRRVGWVHSGFLKAAQRIADHVVELNLPGPVRVIGHSLGAGISTALAPILKANGLDVVEVVLFGSPRALLPSAAKRFDIPCTSYRNGHDFVTTVPRRSWGFRHPVELTQLGKRGDDRTWSDHWIPLYTEALSNGHPHRASS